MNYVFKKLFSQFEAGIRNIYPLKGEDFYNQRQTWAGRKETYNGSSPSSSPWDLTFTKLQFNFITVPTMAFVILMFIWDWYQLKSLWNVQNIGLEPNVGLCSHYLTKLSICKYLGNYWRRIIETRVKYIVSFHSSWK